MPELIDKLTLAFIAQHDPMRIVMLVFDTDWYAMRHAKCVLPHTVHDVIAFDPALVSMVTGSDTSCASCGVPWELPECNREWTHA